MTIGCETHTASIVFRGGAPTVAALETLVEVEWERVLDGTAAARVRFAPGDCCDDLPDLWPWAHELVIVRDGDRVFEGPIIDVAYEGDFVEIQAFDLTAWFDVRLVVDDIDTTAAGIGPVDVARLAERLIRATLALDDPGIGDYLTVTDAGETTERVIESGQVTVGDELRTLAAAGLDFTALGRRIIIGETTASNRFSLTDADFRGPIRLYLDGFLATTQWFVFGAASDVEGQDGIEGSAGGVDPFFGLVQRAVQDETVMDAATADRVATDRIAAHNPPPLAIDMPNNAAINPDSGVTVADMVPGALVDVFAGETCRKVSATFRLYHVQVVENGGSDEEVKVSLGPVGAL